SGGVLTGPTVVGKADPIYGVALGDLNADGHLDVVAIAGSSVIALLAKPGGSGYTQQVLAKGLLYTIGPRIGDVNGDGRLDVVTCAVPQTASCDPELGSPAIVRVFLQQADGTYVEEDHDVNAELLDVTLGDA